MVTQVMAKAQRAGGMSLLVLSRTLNRVVGGFSLGLRQIIYLGVVSIVNNLKLYVIGNGFDLWHEIPSNFWQFKQFVGEHDSDLLEAIDNYVPVNQDWSELESALAAIDADSIIDDLGHLMASYSSDDWSDSGHHDFQYEVTQLVQRLSKGLRHRFGQWIRQLPIPELGSACRRLRTIDPTARFLTFNYTRTLGEMYGVPASLILHIHGRAEDPDSNLILGHAWNPLERRSLNDRPDIEEIDTRLMEVHGILDGYFSATFKPSARLILEHREFFAGLAGVEDVCILGHSLSSVDEPYFKALLAIPGLSTARWQVACRDNGAPSAVRNRLVELGVDERNVNTSLWSAL